MSSTLKICLTTLAILYSFSSTALGFDVELPRTERIKPKESHQQYCQQLQPPSVESSQVIVAYADPNRSYGAIYAVAILDGEKISKAENFHTAPLKKVFEITNGKEHDVQIHHTVDYYGTDRCTWDARVLATRFSPLALFASQPTKLINLKPDQKDIDLFERVIGYKLRKMLEPEGNKPRFKGKILLATSDIDNDGTVEFWYPWALKWHTGLAISKVVDGTVVDIAKQCPHCD